MMIPQALREPKREDVKLLRKHTNCSKSVIVAFLAIPFDSLDGSELRERLKSVGCLGSETDCE